LYFYRKTSKNHAYIDREIIFNEKIGKSSKLIPIPIERKKLKKLPKIENKMAVLVVER
jgi:hypothetical protein